MSTGHFLYASSPVGTTEEKASHIDALLLFCTNVSPIAHIKLNLRFAIGVVVLCLLHACSSSHVPERTNGYIETDSCSIYYESIGCGTPIIVLHGLGFDHTYFSPHLDTLAYNYRLIFIDMRGSGKSIDSSLISLQQVTLDIEAVRKSLGLDSFVLMGHSLGGLVAMKYATLFPEKLSAMILVAPNAAIAKPDSMVSPAPAKSKGKLKANNPHYDKSFESYNLLPELSKVSTATLLISAERDPIPASVHVQIASTMKNCTHITVKNSGHFVFADQPAEFCLEVNNFSQNK